MVLYKNSSNPNTLVTNSVFSKVLHFITQTLLDIIHNIFLGPKALFFEVFRIQILKLFG